MKVGNYEQMMAHLKDPFNPSELRARVKELEQRESFAIGGGAFVGQELPNNREGFSELYGPNIRKMTKSDSFEVTLNRGGKNFYDTFSYGDGSGSGPKPDYATKEEALEAAKKFRDSIKNLKKDTGKFSQGRPIGYRSPTGGYAEIRNALKNIMDVGGKSFSNEDIRSLVDMDIFSNDETFRKAVDAVKKEPEFKNLKFIRKPRARKSDDPVSVLRARVAKTRSKKLDALGSKKYEKELYDFKKLVQESLGLKPVKTTGAISGKPREFLPIDMGHQSSIDQLKKLKQSLRPEDLSPQFYKANREGIQKFEGGVKTLENSLNRKFYPEQKKLYNQAKKFIDAGKEIPADLQNKIIASNEEIQKFVDKTVEKYPMLKDRVNPITIDANDLTVKRGNNVFRQLGMGLVDKNLGDIKIGSIDDLTIKMNLAEQTLKEAIDAGLIDEVTGRQKINKFLKAEVINEYENNKAMLAKEYSQFCDIQKNASGTGSLACTPDEITKNMKKAATTEAGKARVLNLARNAGRVFGKIVAPADVLIETAFMYPHLLRGDVQGAIAASTAGFFGAGRDEIEEAEKEYGKDSPLYNLYQRDKAIGDMAMHINKMDRLSGTLKKLIPSEGEITNFSTINDPRARVSKESYLQQTLNDFIEEAQNKPKIQESFNLYAPKINTPALQFQALDQAYKLSDKIQSSGYYKPDEKGQYPLLQRLESPGIKDLRTTFTKKDIEDRYVDMPLDKTGTDRTFPYTASELSKLESQGVLEDQERIMEEIKKLDKPIIVPMKYLYAGGRVSLADGDDPKDPSKRATLKKIGVGGGLLTALSTGVLKLTDLVSGTTKATKATEAVRRASRAEEIFFDLVRNVKNKGVMREARFTADEPGGVIYEHAGVKVIDEEPYVRVEFETDKGAPAVIEYRKPGYDVDPETQTTIKDPGGFEYEGQEVGRIRPNGDVDIDFEEEIIDEITNVEKIAKGE